MDIARSLRLRRPTVPIIHFQCKLTLGDTLMGIVILDLTRLVYTVFSASCSRSYALFVARYLAILYKNQRKSIFIFYN